MSKTQAQSSPATKEFSTEKTVPETGSAVYGSVYVTKDYGIFKTLDGNRNINKAHLARLKKSLEAVHLVSIVIVNENMEVIDGTHRVTNCRELGLPVYYFVCPKYGLKEVQILNANMQNWSADDYLTGYCDLGLPDYLQYAEFKKRFNFGHPQNIALLTKNLGTDKKFGYKLGEFKVNDYKWAVKTAEQIAQLEPYFEDYKCRSFILSLLQCLKVEDFNLPEFIEKVKLQPTALKRVANHSQFLDMIEKIYNYKRRYKVNLRYATKPVKAKKVKVKKVKAAKVAKVTAVKAYGPAKVVAKGKRGRKPKVQKVDNVVAQGVAVPVAATA